MNAIATKDQVMEQSKLEIRPFRVNIPEDALDDLRQRIAATRWPLC